MFYIIMACSDLYNNALTTLLSVIENLLQTNSSSGISMENWAFYQIHVWLNLLLYI
jgi:hypothetical protein